MPVCASFVPSFTFANNSWPIGNWRASLRTWKNVSTPTTNPSPPFSKRFDGCCNRPLRKRQSARLVFICGRSPRPIASASIARDNLHAQHTRHPPAHQVGQEHGANHKGHADGCFVENAQGEAGRPGGEPAAHAEA